MSENGLFGNGLAFGLALRTNDMRVDHDNKMNQAQAIIDREFAEKMAALEEIKKLKLALAVQTAHGTALNDKLKAVTSALKTVSPQHELLRETGRTFPSGAKETKAAYVYYNSFDAKAKSLGINEPIKYRVTAK